MTYNYGRTVSHQHTPQSRALFGREKEQIKNAAGGFVFKLDQETLLKRFLILGSEAGTYYTGPAKLTRENAKNVIQCWQDNPEGTANLIAAISDEGRAPKNDPAIFALALGATHTSDKARAEAYRVFGQVIRIPTHLFQFCEWANAIVPLGSTRFRKAISSWYNSQENLAFSVVKYQNREGWSHKDVLRLAHTKPSRDHKITFDWIFGKESKDHEGPFPLPEVIEGFERAKLEKDEKKLATLVRRYGLTREMIPTEGLAMKEVWDALLEKMPLTAMIRNLGNMTKIGLISPLSTAEKHVTSLLGNVDALKKARVHPMTLLLALRVYEQGRGDKGSGVWTPSQKVCDALEQAFYAAYGNVIPTGKRLLIGLDVSGSMSAPINGAGTMTAYDAAAALGLVFLNTEPNAHIIGFGTASHELPFGKRTSLREAQRKLQEFHEGTDLAQPYIYASQRRMSLDGFITVTDDETWAGRQHPSFAYKNYAGDRDIKNVILSTTATQGGVGDPKDPRVLQVAGFDSSVPQVVNQFLS